MVMKLEKNHFFMHDALVNFHLVYNSVNVRQLFGHAFQLSGDDIVVVLSFVREFAIAQQRIARARVHEHE